MDRSLMAQQFQQTAIDLDADGDSLPVITAPAAPTATEITTLHGSLDTGALF